MQKASFDLRDWEFTGMNNTRDVSSILGISWNKKGDISSLNMDFLGEVCKPVSKRGFLATAYKIFDPIGWYSPTVLQRKLMLK